MKASINVCLILPLLFLLSSCQQESSLFEKSTSKNTVKETVKITGVDVSKYQGTIDFKKVEATGVRYVFVRATEGITYQDKDFKADFTAAQAAGLVTGAYHFYESNDDPIDQLNNFIAMVTLKKGDLPPIVDIEKLHHNDQTDLHKNIQIFLDGLEQHYGVKPIIYSGLNFANKFMTGFGEYPLWLAEYQVDQPSVPEGWSDWTFWQWSQVSKVDGINGAVDGDRYNGNETAFRKLLIK